MAAYASKGAVKAAETSVEEEDDNVKKTPEFTNLRWEKNGKEVKDALVDDEVSLCFDVRNINNGEQVKVMIWEHDEDNEHDHVADLEGTVENGQVKKTWKVVYTEDNDDSTSGKELAEKGYTLPEYHFVAEYDGQESGESPVMEVKGWVKIKLNKHQQNVLSKYTFKLSTENFDHVFNINIDDKEVFIGNLPISPIWQIGVDNNAC
jgi:hypothetical protein